MSRLPVGLAMAMTVLATPAIAAPIACVPVRQAVALRLGDTTSRAEILLPAEHSPRAVAVLFAGSDVADRDGAVAGSDQRVVSRPIRQVAEALSCAGYASIRYDKRHVTGRATVDRARFDTLTGRDLADDGRAALAAARTVPGLAALPVVLVGWSEGTTVAMAAAAREPATRAVVLMAPVIDAPAVVAQAQYRRVGRPYLMRFAQGGALDADAVARAGAASPGVLAAIFVRMFCGFAPGERIKPLLDTNRDGRISFAEADSVIAGWYADRSGSGLGMSGSDRALPGVRDAWTASGPPVLVPQGVEDAMAEPAVARAFAARADVAPRLTLKLYPGLGHSPESAESAAHDALMPTDQRPLADLVAWLDRVPMTKAAGTVADEAIALHIDASVDGPPVAWRIEPDGSIEFNSTLPPEAGNAASPIIWRAGPSAAHYREVRPARPRACMGWQNAPVWEWRARPGDGRDQLGYGSAAHVRHDM